MSASNWSVCPSCLQRATATKVAEEQAAADAYGKVPVEDFDRLRTIAATPVDEDALRTFREDYEFWLDGTTVKVSYEGFCNVCRSGIKFKDERPIEMKEPPSKQQEARL